MPTDNNKTNEKHDLNLNDDFTTQTLSWYIWGQKEAPKPNEVADEKWIDRKDEITLKIDPNQFLQKTGNIINARDFKLFNTFFSGKTQDRNNLNIKNIKTNIKYKNNEYYLTQKQFADLFYKDKNGKPIKVKNKKNEIINLYEAAKYPRESKDPKSNHPTRVSLYNRNLDNPDFAKLAFVFGSLKVGLDTDKIRYILDANLKPLRVEGVEYIINEKPDNFDFNGGAGSEKINKILRQIADPSGIGKTVKLDFQGGARLNNETITANDYAKTRKLDLPYLDENIARDIAKNYIPHFQKEVISPIPSDPYFNSGVGDFYKKYELFLAEFNRIKQTGVINYRDENDKIVIFGEKTGEYGAKNFNLNGNVKIDGFPDWLVTKLAKLNHFKPYLQNGIHHVDKSQTKQMLSKELSIEEQFEIKKTCMNLGILDMNFYNFNKIKRDLENEKQCYINNGLDQEKWNNDFSQNLQNTANKYINLRCMTYENNFNYGM